ncbi:MAG: Gfo/Idh/MocA family oxidoreductase [Anaerolineales bacterium]|nr:Gfo/Idh/MocA family oxidoreductase [Anaerolineales bacterium]
MLNVGVIGIGAMGRNHVRVYSEMDSVRLVAAADTNPVSCKKFAEQYNRRAYTDYREMLAQEKLDAVSVVVPTSLHRQVAEEVMAHGIPILLEKPVATTHADGRAIITAARKAGILLAIGHIERFNPAIVALKKRLEVNELGKLFEIRTRRLGPIPGRIEDTGVVVDLATHDIDLMQSLTNSPINRLSAETQRRVHLSHEDSFFGMIKFENGMNGLLDVSWLVPTKVRQTLVVGERGMFVVDTLTQEFYFYENDYPVGSGLPGAHIIEGNMTKIKIDRREPLRVQLENFVNKVAQNEGTIVTGEEGLLNLDVALAFITSASDGRVVHRSEFTKE